MESLKRDVQHLAASPRPAADPEATERALRYLEQRLPGARRLPFPGGVNLEATRLGSPQVIVVGAHYDTEAGTPGADDNASGLAALLALAESAHRLPPGRTLRFVAFANEERPHFQTPSMGSYAYALECRRKNEDVVAMLSLESLGYFRRERGTQRFPKALEGKYPDRGDFVAVVGNAASRELMGTTSATLRRHVPVQVLEASPDMEEAAWSDHWAFWKVGYPAVMATDTLPFRNPHYHRPTDTPDTLDYETLSRVVQGLEDLLRRLAPEGSTEARRSAAP